jgi:hypothetical protein
MPPHILPVVGGAAELDALGGAVELEVLGGAVELDVLGSGSVVAPVVGTLLAGGVAGNGDALVLASGA